MTPHQNTKVQSQMLEDCDILKCGYQSSHLHLPNYTANNLSILKNAKHCELFRFGYLLTFSPYMQ